MIIFWTAALIIFLVIEAATVGLTSIWFAFGSMVSLIATALSAPLWLQISLFLLVSCITVFFTRPLAVKYLNNKKKATNADRVLAMVGIVTSNIDNIIGTGTVKVGGKEWSARSANGAPIKTGTLVRPVMIDGVKLIVSTADETAKQTLK